MPRKGPLTGYEMAAPAPATPTASELMARVQQISERSPTGRLAEALQSSDAAAAASSAAEMEPRVQKLALRTVSQPTTLGKDKAWAEMTEAEQEAARELGWIEASWDGGEVTQACSWMWAALPPPQRTAAVTLGYAEAAWNAELQEAQIDLQAQLKAASPTPAATFAAWRTTSRRGGAPGGTAAPAPARP